jgi:glycosyltransferase involved in cell wall biosynthesis
MPICIRDWGRVEGRMKVLHILNELKPSGAEAMLRAAGTFWRGRGIEGEILCTGESLGTYAEPLREAGYQIHHIPFCGSISYLWQLYRFLKKHAFDGVHLHTERGSFWYAALAYLAGRRRIVRTFHNVFPFTGGLRIRRYVQRFAMRRILTVRPVAISRSVRDCEWEVFHNPAVLIPNWFDSNCYSPPTPEGRTSARATLGIEPTTMALASVAGCWSYKNHHAILHAIARIPRDLDILYLHAGQEREDHDERHLAIELGISSRVRFLGVVPDIALILRACDVFVMPSTYEGFGVAAAEAMGAGLPVILSNVAGLRDMHDVDDSIYWIEPTADDVAKAILHFHRTTDAERRATGRKLSQQAHKLFNIETGAALYADLYQGRA